MNTNTIASRLANDSYNDEYCKKLFIKYRKLNAIEMLLSSSICEHDITEVRDLLRFSDILSFSMDVEHRIAAYEGACFAYPFCRNEPHLLDIVKAVILRLGVFPGANVIDQSDSLRLPPEREIDTAIKKAIQSVPYNERYSFTDAQYSIFDKIVHQKEFSFSAPTSMGKSFIIKSLIFKFMNNTPADNIVVVVPTRALISQMAYDIKQDLRSHLEILNYQVLTNSNANGVQQKQDSKYIFVLTPERFMSLLSTNSTPTLGYVFVDEAHKMCNSKDARSIITYSVIKKSLRKYPNINIYFSSPYIANPEQFLKAFNRNYINAISLIEKPVAQHLYFVDLSSNTIELEHKSSFKQLIPSCGKFSYDGEYDFIYKTSKNDNVLIYCNTVEKTISSAIEFSSYLTANEISTSVENTEELIALAKNISEYIHTDFYLVELVKHRIGFHYGDLPQVVRNFIEEAFKNKVIQYLFTTSTLLEGVNLPARLLYIMNIKKNFSKIDFLNLAGRAGRLGNDIYGGVFYLKKSMDHNSSNLLDNSSSLAHILSESTNIIIAAEDRITQNLRKVKSIIEDKNISGSEQDKEVLGNLANVARSDLYFKKTDDYDSPLFMNLSEKKYSSLQKCVEDQKLSIPMRIIEFNESINAFSQESMYVHVLNSELTKLKLSNKPDFKTIKQTLELFYKYYQWNKYEKKLSNFESLAYYAYLMNSWINGNQLNEIIRNSILYYEEYSKKIKINYHDFVIFDRHNRDHINQLIKQIVSDIEKVLRYRLEKYFSHYYSVLINRFGEEKSGPNWALFLEYGSINRFSIALQNFGFSRYVANSLSKNYRQFITKNELNGIEISVSDLKNELRINTPEYNEVTKLL